MRAVFLEVPEEIVLERHRLGIHRNDEMWEGELHMSPPPGWDHQRIDKYLSSFFLNHWELLGEGVFCSNVGLKQPGTPDVDIAGVRMPRNYRAPDLVFLLKGHEQRIRRGWVVGAADALIEIRSPGDETYEKFPYYHDLDIPEVIVIHRDGLSVEVYRRGKTKYRAAARNSDGSVTSRVLDTAFRTESSRGGRASVLHLRRLRHPDRRATI